MIKRLLSILVLICFSFQICFAGNGYEDRGSDTKETKSDVASGKENSENKIQLADEDYYKLLLNYPVPVASINDSHSYLSLPHGNIYQKFSLYPDLKISKKIKVTLKNDTTEKGKLQEITNEFVYINNGSDQKIRMTDIAQIEFKKKGIDAYKGALIGLGVGVIVGIVMSEAADFTATSEYFFFTLLWTGIGAGIGAAAGASGDGGNTVTIVPIPSKK